MDRIRIACNFEIISPEESTMLILNFDYEKHKSLNDKLASSGYDSNNALLNEGTVFHVILINVGVKIIVKILWALKKAEILPESVIQYYKGLKFGIYHRVLSVYKESFL